MAQWKAYDLKLRRDLNLSWKSKLVIKFNKWKFKSLGRWISKANVDGNIADEIAWHAWYELINGILCNVAD